MEASASLHHCIVSVTVRVIKLGCIVSCCMIHAVVISETVAYLQVKPILARLKTTLAGSTAALILSAGLLVGLVQAGTDSDGSYGKLLDSRGSFVYCCIAFFCHAHRGSLICTICKPLAESIQSMQFKRLTSGGSAQHICMSWHCNFSFLLSLCYIILRRGSKTTTLKGCNKGHTEQHVIRVPVPGMLAAST